MSDPMTRLNAALEGRYAIEQPVVLQVATLLRPLASLRPPHSS